MSVPLIDAFFVNTQIHKQTSSNIFTLISDHIPQFANLKNIFS